MCGARGSWPWDSTRVTEFVDPVFIGESGTAPVASDVAVDERSRAFRQWKIPGCMSSSASSSSVGKWLIPSGG